MQTPDLLAAGIRRFPDRDCVVEGNRRHTFAQTHERAARLATALHDQGVGPGDRVAILAMNELEYTEVLVGVQRAGAILVPLNFRLAVPELEYPVADSTPSLLITGPGFEDVDLGLPTWQLGGSYEEALAAATFDLGCPPQDADALAQILYTSGTTGRPKGALISNGALYARYNAYAVESRASQASVFVQGLPMFHIAAHVGWAFAYMGTPQVMIRAFDPQVALGAIDENRATHVLLVPTMINALCAHPAMESTDLSSLELVTYGASPIAPELLRTAIAKFGCGFLQFYGMTETFAITILRPADHDPDAKPHLLPSAGTDGLGAQARIVDEEDNEVAVGEVGEVCARGPAVTTGYWNQPEVSAETLRGGWMHTGDLGYKSEEGYVFIVDRVKDMVVTGGENVYPREVEDVLFAHPDIYEAAVIGIPHERWGEQVHAIVVAAPGAEPTEEDVLSWCRGQLAGYKVPKSVAFIAELPRNAPGKVLKTELRAPHWEGQARGVG